MGGGIDQGVYKLQGKGGQGLYYTLLLKYELDGEVHIFVFNKRKIPLIYRRGRNFRWKNISQILRFWAKAAKLSSFFLIPENVDSRKLIPAKFSKICYSRKLIIAKFFKNS